MSSINNIDLSEIKKILIIQFEPWGDVLITAGYTKAIKGRFPNWKIDFLVSHPYDKILDKNPNIDEIVSIPKAKKIKDILNRIKMFIDIRHRKYDLIIDQQNAHLSVQTILFSGAKYKLGWRNGKGKALYNVFAERGKVHYSAAERYDILKPLGIKPQPVELFYHIKEVSISYVNSWFEKMSFSKPVICFSPGSPSHEKIWKKEYYAELADKIAATKKYEIVFLWAPSELEDVKYIMKQMQSKTILAPATDFNQCAAFIKKIDLLICNDGGVNHLSVATQTPSLAFFGRTSALEWSPEGFVPNHFHLTNPDYKYNGDQSFGISPEDAFRKFCEIMKNVE
ncbi:MAG TPA: glycosyltransferase family 9 protein [Candidatus Cloacimonetes bacterium]|nr:glycosyltransferase family 9 protein [Candidatus Cloacimonadota bacterium]